MSAHTYHVQVAKGADVKMGEGELVSAYRAGMVKGKTLAWRDGMENWEPLSTFADELGIEIPEETAAVPSRGIPEPMDHGLKPLPKRRAPVTKLQQTWVGPPAKPDGPAPGEDPVLEIVMLIAGILTSGYFLFFYSTTVPTEVGSTHNLGLLQNRALGAGAGGVMVILSVLIAGFNRRAGRAFLWAIAFLMIAFLAIAVILLVLAAVKSRTGG